LTVLLPQTRFAAIRLEPQIEMAEESLASLRTTSVQVPFAEGELLIAAKTDNMDVVYWVRRPAENPDEWTVAVLGRGMKWVEFDGGLVRFLAEIYSGGFRVPFFPKPRKKIKFVAGRG
ncbi:MAG: hypothetical protein ABW046_11815, partial [Actinoplanes sp.]